jgi:hypothetical protein
VTRCYIYLSDSYFLYFSCWAPSLTRGRVCNLQCNDASSISNYIATDGLSAGSSLCRAPKPDFKFLVWQLLRLLSVGLPHSHPPWTGWSSPKSKVKITIGRAAWEACSETWNLGTNSAFALGPRKPTENLDLLVVGRSQDLPDANRLLASSPALNPRTLTLVPNLCCCVFLFCFFLFFFSTGYILQLFVCAYNLDKHQTV